MRFFVFPLALTLDFHIDALVEMDTIVTHVVMLRTQIDECTHFFTLSSSAVALKDVVLMQSSFVADAEHLPAKVAFLLTLHY